MTRTQELSLILQNSFDNQTIFEQDSASFSVNFVLQGLRTRLQSIPASRHKGALNTNILQEKDFNRIKQVKDTKEIVPGTHQLARCSTKFQHPSHINLVGNSASKRPNQGQIGCMRAQTRIQNQKRRNVVQIRSEAISILFFGKIKVNVDGLKLYSWSLRKGFAAKSERGINVLRVIGDSREGGRDPAEQR
ncbi:Uncharacterized protein TCM_011512 [Theobroma cacao]|uniref:Uncharacterized protein n=1 Tax=Theobroma cacao TaxID=3641 RepID=A0A061EBC6_THECC|nr:Uncharacterized protein TCM_011512 [Theobroma cacao]